MVEDLNHVRIIFMSVIQRIHFYKVLRRFRDANVTNILRLGSVLHKITNLVILSYLC